MIEPETASNTAAASRQYDRRNDADSLQSLLDAIDAAIEAGESVTVRVSRVSAAGRVVVANMPGDQFDPIAVAERYGGGKYLAQPRIGGRMAAGAMFSVEGPAASSPQQPEPRSAPVPTPAAEGVTVSSLFQTLVAMQAQAQQQMTTVLTALIQRDNGPKLSELLPLLKQSTGIGELVTAMRDIKSIVPSESGGSGDDLGSIVAMLAPALLQSQNAANPSTQPRKATPVKDRPRLIVRPRPARTRNPIPAPIALAVDSVRFALRHRMSAEAAARNIIEAARNSGNLSKLLLLAKTMTAAAMAEAISGFYPPFRDARAAAFVEEAAGHVQRHAKLLERAHGDAKRPQAVAAEPTTQQREQPETDAAEEFDDDDAAEEFDDDDAAEEFDDDDEEEEFDDDDEEEEFDDDDDEEEFDDDADDEESDDADGQRATTVPE